MNIIFKLNNGDEIKASIEGFNSLEFETKLNNQLTQFIAVGNGGFQKNNLASWKEEAKIVD
ncbi:hypothetical protein [Bacillus sp. FJAT-22090]|uniref:hypothetical protein n=1 Tax=Bacillus sp. FJAT-22090 TaxID=1581038 RepID=UPI0011AA1E98|nr:hypothetical protein [Bacillus sp. FJAT-22090]